MLTIAAAPQRKVEVSTELKPSAQLVQVTYSSNFNNFNNFNTPPSEKVLATFYSSQTSTKVTTTETTQEVSLAATSFSPRGGAKAAAKLEGQIPGKLEQLLMGEPIQLTGRKSQLLAEIRPTSTSGINLKSSITRPDSSGTKADIASSRQKAAIQETLIDLTPTLLKATFGEGLRQMFDAILESPKARREREAKEALQEQARETLKIQTARATAQSEVAQSKAAISRASENNTNSNQSSAKIQSIEILSNSASSLETLQSLTSAAQELESNMLRTEENSQTDASLQEEMRLASAIDQLITEIPNASSEELTTETSLNQQSENRAERFMQAEIIEYLTSEASESPEYQAAKQIFDTLKLSPNGQEIIEAALISLENNRGTILFTEGNGELEADRDSLEELTSSLDLSDLSAASFSLSNRAELLEEAETLAA